MKKSFDCVEMKRKAQERIYEETRRLSRKNELEYFHEAAEDFWREIRSLRKNRVTQSVRKIQSGTVGRRPSAAKSSN